MSDTGVEVAAETAAEAEAVALARFAPIMARLRAECPWKAGQTHESLTRYLLEEAYETVEAIDGGDPAHLREELGDLLLQIYFHCAIAAERGDFDLGDVVETLHDKMVRRNPHVFGAASGDSGILGATEVDAQWQRIKSAEKPERTSLTAGLPAALPALLLATKVLERQAVATAASTPSASAGELPRSEATITESELGSELLALVARAVAAGIDPEASLRRAVLDRVGAEAEPDLRD